MRVRYSAAADSELAEAVDWYASLPDAGERLADEFLDELTRIEALISERPRAWPEIELGIRRVVMRRYPFGLIYRIEAGEVHILAVAHHSRRPGYWRDRVG